MKLTDATKQQFFTLVDTAEDPSKCWLWKGSISCQRGYGRIKQREGTKWRSYLAHRVSYVIHNPTVPLTQLVLHSCDNPSCVNPNHLRQGTHEDNMQDAVNRKRLICSKLSEEIILAIYKADRNQCHTLAAKYGVTVVTIKNIWNLSCKTYKEIILNEIAN